MHRRILLIIMLFLTASVAAAQEATTEPAPLPEGIPDSAGYEWALVADGFDSPIGIVPANDGTGRMFAWEQSGKMWVINGEEVSFEPFLDIGALVPPSVIQGGYSEQGLLGVAFHPQYEENGYFYIHYSDVNGDTTIARYKVSSDPEVADPASGTIILSVDQPYPDHNGGEITFGPDGYLYIGLGDGGNPDDPLRNGQNLNTMLGKILRIDVNATPYKVPPDNPFVGRSDAKPEIWAYGLRNPFRFSFDRETGDLFIGDVGQWDYEEVDFAPAGVGGQNYGWSAYQGMHEYIKQTKPIDETMLTMPILEYPHLDGCSITGGYIYRGAALPELNGVYLYGDYCNGRMWAAVKNGDAWQGGIWMETGLTITSFGEDESSELYLTDYKGGIYKLVASQP